MIERSRARDEAASEEAARLGNRALKLGAGYGNDALARVAVPQGLQLFYAMYAVTLVLGIQDISDALYKSFKTLFSGVHDIEYVALNTALFLGILLLAVRFFWSTGNIRRAWVRSERPGHRIAPVFIVIHLPILLLQGVFVLFLCSAFSDGGGSIAPANPITFWFIFVTGRNATWLCMLTWPKAAWPEKFWLFNNLALVILGTLLLFALHIGCLSELAALAIFAVLSVSSSILDLWQTAPAYLSDVGY